MFRPKKLRECGICGEDKPITDFNKHAKSKDGRRCYCRDCATQLMRNYRAKGRSTTSEFSGRHTTVLLRMYKELTKELKKRGRLNG